MKPATVVSKKHGAPRAVFIHFTGSCVGGYVPGACQQPVIPVTASTHPDAIFKLGKVSNRIIEFKILNARQPALSKFLSGINLGVRKADDSKTRLPQQRAQGLPRGLHPGAPRLAKSSSPTLTISGSPSFWRLIERHCGA